MTDNSEIEILLIEHRNLIELISNVVGGSIVSYPICKDFYLDKYHYFNDKLMIVDDDSSYEYKICYSNDNDNLLIGKVLFYQFIVVYDTLDKNRKVLVLNVNNNINF